jgi:hypothetical protein
MSSQESRISDLEMTVTCFITGAHTHFQQQIIGFLSAVGGMTLVLGFHFRLRMASTCNK